MLIKRCIFVKIKTKNMKKLFITAILLTGFVFTAQSQNISKNALGLRLGSNDGFGGEISYQRALGSNNRLELDLGIRSNDFVDAFKLAALYQWVWNIEGGFNWYAGLGGGVGTWSYNDNFKKNNQVFFNNSDFDDSGVTLFAAGDIGIEYDFDAPIMISLDFRPEFYINGYENQDNFGSDIAFSVRYQF